MKSVFQEKLEFIKSIFNTKHGILIWLIEAFIWGYIIVNYTPQIFTYLNNSISISNLALKNYLSYLAYGLILTPLGLIITFILNKLLSILFKNGSIIK